jgi:ubiquitin carboxyl-terminal hydrolase 34
VPDENWDWRFKLEEDDIIDCPDDTVWYNSTIIEKQVIKDDDDCGVPIISYKVGFRIYSEDGSSLDVKSGRHFYGWSGQYDEDLRATSPRIQKLNKFSKSFCKYASMSYAEESVKDCNDFLYDLPDKPVFAVPRFYTRTQRRSSIMIELV